MNVLEDNLDLVVGDEQTIALPGLGTAGYMWQEDLLQGLSRQRSACPRPSASPSEGYGLAKRSCVSSKFGTGSQTRCQSMNVG